MAGAESSYFGMHVLDLAVAAWLTLFAFRGYTRGLVQEVMSLAALVLALVAAFRWTPTVVPRFAEMIPGPSFLDTAIVFLFLFGAAGMTLRMLASLITRSWATRSSAFNRLGGAVFGMAKGAVVLGSTVLMLRTFTPIPSSTAANPFAGPMQKLNGRLAESLFAARLADVTSGLFSALVDAAEIRLRMLAASDNERP